MRWPHQLLQAGRHRRVRLLAALLAFAPDALVLADARPPALLAFAPSALVHTVICQHQRIRSKCKDCLEEAAEEADTSMPAGLEELAGPAHAAGKDL